MKLQSGVGGVGSEPFALDSDMAEWFVMWGLVRGWLVMLVFRRSKRLREHKLLDSTSNFTKFYIVMEEQINKLAIVPIDRYIHRY